MRNHRFVDAVKQTCVFRALTNQPSSDLTSGECGMHEEMNTKHLDKILVVDDATPNLPLLTHLLTENGHTVYFSRP